MKSPTATAFCALVLLSHGVLLGQPEGATWQRNVALVGTCPLDGGTMLREWKTNGKKYLVTNGNGGLAIVDVASPAAGMTPLLVVQGFDPLKASHDIPLLGADLELYTTPDGTTYAYMAGDQVQTTYDKVNLNNFPGYVGFVFNLTHAIATYSGTIAIDPDDMSGVYVNGSSAETPDANLYTGRFRCDVTTVSTLSNGSYKCPVNNAIAAGGVETVTIDADAKKLFISSPFLRIYDLTSDPAWPENPADYAAGAPAFPAPGGNFIGTFIPTAYGNAYVNGVAGNRFVMKPANANWPTPTRLWFHDVTPRHIADDASGNKRTRMYLSTLTCGIWIVDFTWSKTAGVWDDPDPYVANPKYNFVIQ